MAKRKKGTINTSKKYFHGINTLVAKATGYTHEYVGNVLRGHYEDRDTVAIRKIKKTAELFMTTVKEAETLESA